MKNILFSMGLIYLLTACTAPAPKYSPSYENVKLLKSANTKVKVLDFTASTSKLRNISLRGTSLQSPYGKDMVDYLQNALKSELEKAGLFDANGDAELTAIIVENDIDTAMSEASGVISADFSVSRKGHVLYKKNIKIRHTWESSFVGAIAIPRAADSYKPMTEKLLNKLFSDADFITALKS